MILGDNKAEMNELVRIEAQQSMMYILPDSTKVWMKPGSSIQFAKDFNKDRKVWLSGNSLFEVYKHEGSTFQVHINKAFIEVKELASISNKPMPKRTKLHCFVER